MNQAELRKKLAAVEREIERLQKQIQRLESQRLVVKLAYRPIPDEKERIRRIFAFLRDDPKAKKADRKKKTEC